jgi:hypothetical protein
MASSRLAPARSVWGADGGRLSVRFDHKGKLSLDYRKGRSVMYDAKDYAEEHRKFLVENNPSVLSGQKDQNSYLSLVGQQAEEMFEHLMTQRRRQVQDLPHLEKVRKLQAFRHQADEMVRHDLIYQPLPASSTARTPVSRPSSDLERDDRDTEKMVATLKRVAERRRQQERSSASLPLRSGAMYDQEKFPSAAALVMARAARRVAVKYGDFGLAKAAKELHERADAALTKRQSVLKARPPRSEGN